MTTVVRPFWHRCGTGEEVVQHCRPGPAGLRLLTLVVSLAVGPFDLAVGAGSSMRTSAWLGRSFGSSGRWLSQGAGPPLRTDGIAVLECRTRR